MNYRYTFTKIDMANLYFQIKYESAGRDPYYKNFRTENFDPANMNDMAEDFGKVVVHHWTTSDAQPDTPPIPEGTFVDTSYDIPPEVIQVPRPDHDPYTQVLVEGTEIINGDLYQTWTIVDKTGDELAEGEAQRARDEDLSAIKDDTQVKTLLKQRPNAINNYIDNNVTNMNEAKEVLKVYGRAIAVLAQTLLR